MYLPKAMRGPRKAGKAHYYINPATIEIYPNGETKVRLTRKQIEQIMEIFYDYVPSQSQNEVAK